MKDEGKKNEKMEGRKAIKEMPYSSCLILKFSLS